MRRLTEIIAGLFVFILWTNSASADAVISGPVCVLDGNTLQIGGKAQNDSCWGGIDVRLHGSIAPQLNETCTDTAGNSWDCGTIAKEALKKVITRHSISCYHIGGEFDGRMPVVTCISGRIDLALEMVVMGMAKALHTQSNRYELEEKDAMQAKRGLWK